MARIKKHVSQDSVEIAPRRRRSKELDGVKAETRKETYPIQQRVSPEGHIFTNTGTIAIGPKAAMEAQIARCLENVELARQRMANDQIEIDRLRLETRALISEMLT